MGTNYKIRAYQLAVVKRSTSLPVSLIFSLWWSSSFLISPTVHVCDYLLYRQECFSGKWNTRRVQTKLHPGLEWRISISAHW